MRPTITSKHREAQERIRRDMEAYEQAGGQVRSHSPTERARPPVDHWQDRIGEDFRIHESRTRGVV